MELKTYFAKDDSGEILANATCYLYQRGTETLARGLLMATGTELGNPFTCDDSGYVQFAAPNGLYDLRIVQGIRDKRISVQCNDISDTQHAADLAADRAELARDVAGVKAGLKRSVAEGLRDTVNGEYFTVAASADVYAVQYLNQGGVAVEQNRLSSDSAVKAAKGLASSAMDAAVGQFSQIFPGLFKSQSRMVDGVFDENGFPIWGVRDDGVAVAVLDALPGLGILSKWAWVIYDANGYVLFGIQWDGTVYLYNQKQNASGTTVYVENGDVFCTVEGVAYQLTSSGVNFSPEVSGSEVSFLSRSGPLSKQLKSVPAKGSTADFIRKILHIVGSGQSLSMGAYSTPVATTIPPIANRLFTIANGVRLSNQDGTLNASDVAPFAPMVSLYTEVPVVQHAAQLGRRGSIPADAGVLVSLHGRNNHTISQLSKGSVFYQNSLTAVAAAKAECDAKGLDYDVPYIDWIQGEANNATSEEEYFQALMQLQADYQADLNAIIGKNTVRPLVLSQISNWTAYNRAESGVPFAQLRAALDFPAKFICAGPKYWLPTVSDGIHLPADASMRLGCMHGMAGEAVINGRAWLPTHCTRAVRAGRVITLDFYTPHGALVVDKVAVTDPGNWGLRYVDSNGAASISSVRLLGGNRVAVTLASEPTGTGAFIGIADIGTATSAGGPTTGARACLRDSEIIKDGYGLPFYNWAAHQRLNVEI